jgi:hypothetical protein
MTKPLMNIPSNNKNSQLTHTKTKKHSHTKNPPKIIQLNKTQFTKMVKLLPSMKISNTSSKLEMQEMKILLASSKHKLKELGTIVKKPSFPIPL